MSLGKNTCTQKKPENACRKYGETCKIGSASETRVFVYVTGIENLGGEHELPLIVHPPPFFRTFGPPALSMEVREASKAVSAEPT